MGVRFPGPPPLRARTVPAVHKAAEARYTKKPAGGVPGRLSRRDLSGFSPRLADGVFTRDGWLTAPKLSPAVLARIPAICFSMSLLTLPPGSTPLSTMMVMGGTEESLARQCRVS